MIERLLDLTAFFIWDRSWYFRPSAIRLAFRLDQTFPPKFKAMYYRRVLAGLTPRKWRYIQSRAPEIAASWDAAAVVPVEGIDP